MFSILAGTIYFLCNFVFVFLFRQCFRCIMDKTKTIKLLRGNSVVMSREAPRPSTFRGGELFQI